MTIECYAVDTKGVLRVYQARTFPHKMTVDETLSMFATINHTARLFGWTAPRCQEVRHEQG